MIVAPYLLATARSGATSFFPAVLDRDYRQEFQYCQQSQASQAREKKM
jgi:hypothetical protein